jgi:hypothetical protein
MPFPILNRFLTALAIWCLLPLASCGPSKKSEPEKKNEGPPADALSQKIEAFTGGHTKAVWARYSGKASDVFANYDRLHLWGIDTRDGKGPRQILKERSNYARPLILPDGSGILFSNKQTTQEKKSGKKRFDPVIKRVDWNGENLTELGKGYAVDVWRDPRTGTDWVYVSDLLGTERSSIEGTRLERFPLAEPEKRELVWDKTRISTENVQLSRDGTRASCLFPWPDAGVLNLETKSHLKYQHGCWPSMAPDASHHAWVFDGAHKNLFMFTDGAAENWTVPVNTAPGIGKHEMYHPRWSNHVRYLSITGPYTGATPTRSDTGVVEVLIGKFSPDLKKVEAWLQLTDDDAGDFFPDLWIAGGELASVEPAKPKPAPGKAPEAAPWPADGVDYRFVWKNRDARNAVDAAASRLCSVEAKGAARFGPHFEMLAEGGYFLPDQASAEAILAQGNGKPFTLEAMITPGSADQAGTVVFSTSLVLRQDGGRLGFGLPGRGLQDLGEVKAGTATHVAVAFDGQTLKLYRDGAPVAGNAVPGQTPDATGQGAGLPEHRVMFGGAWAGAIEGVAFQGTAASPETIAASAAFWKTLLAARSPIPTLRVRGKLVEITADRPVEALDTYHRALLGYLYEVEEVIEGEFTEKQIAVMHWTILDRQLLPGFPREIGKSYDLTLQPYAAHPQLVSERQWNDLLDPLEPWYDIATPAARD